MNKMLCAAAGLLAAACLAGCADRTSQAPAGEAESEVYAAVMTADGGIKQTVLFAEPDAAVSAIYSSLAGTPKLTEVEEDALKGVFGISAEDVEEAVVYVSDAKSGLCDVAVLLPAPGRSDAVREALMQYRTLRAEEFKNYDILNAYSIASGAAVFDQGDYVVLLMLPDNEAAQEILDQYMPK